MQGINATFHVIRQMFKSTVHPCQITTDEDAHYEVRAIKKDAHGETLSDKLVGYVVKHEDSVTVGFDSLLNDAVKRELFSTYLIQKMNRESRIRIHRMTAQLHSDLQSAIDQLLRYYTKVNWA